MKECKIGGPHLIVCPLSVLATWSNEFKRSSHLSLVVYLELTFAFFCRWCPSMKVVTFHGVIEERERLKDQLTSVSFDAIVTTYEMLKVEVFYFGRFHWTYVILDEGKYHFLFIAFFC